MCPRLHVAIYFISFIPHSIGEINIVELFSKAKHLQQSVAAKVGEEMEVITTNESHSESDSEVECLFKDSNSISGNKGRLVSSSSCDQEDGDCNEISKSLMQGMMKTKRSES